MGTRFLWRSKVDYQEQGQGQSVRKCRILFPSSWEFLSSPWPIGLHTNFWACNRTSRSPTVVQTPSINYIRTLQSITLFSHRPTVDHSRAKGKDGTRAAPFVKVASASIFSTASPTQSRLHFQLGSRSRHCTHWHRRF